MTDSNLKPMTLRSYKVTFLTPAFLGDANQSGEWRTPAFKALLRQWWRVAVARGLSCNVDALRQREAELFGTAAGDTGTASKVRIRLSEWGPGDGTSKTWPKQDPTVTHPEVKDKNGKIKPIGSQLYMGYGPLTLEGGTAPKNGRCYITATEKPRDLKLAFPPEYASELDLALQLTEAFGSLGGRSRNGWGSLQLKASGEIPAPAPLPRQILVNWEKALQCDWPHGVGTDDQNQPLIWETTPVSNWEQLIKQLATIKIGLRTQAAFRFNTGHHVGPEARHWLSYPVTNHKVSPWERPGPGKKALRLPNSLRFKAALNAEGRLIGRIVHVPCRPNDDFRPDLRELRSVWAKVHEFLDSDKELRRAKELFA